MKFEYSACYKAMVAKNLYIPQFRGHIQNKPDKGYDNFLNIYIHLTVISTN